MPELQINANLVNGSCINQLLRLFDAAHRNEGRDGADEVEGRLGEKVKQLPSIDDRLRTKSVVSKQHQAAHGCARTPLVSLSDKETLKPRPCPRLRFAAGSNGLRQTTAW